MQFVSSKVSGLSGNTEVILSQEGTTFRIVSDKSGMRFEGTSGIVEDRKDLEILAKAVSDAWTAHRKLLSSQIQMPNGATIN